MIDCSLNLLIHCVFHLSLGMSTVAVQNQHQDQNGNKADDEHLSEAIAVVTDVEYSSLVVILKIWVLKDWLANVRCVAEASANGIHDGLSFHLSAVSTVIDND